MGTVQSIAKTTEPEWAWHLVGRVSGIDQGMIRVCSAGREYAARRATSCLVEPIVGDLVQLTSAERDAWVVAVLERDGGSGVLAWEGDLEVKLPRGRFVVAAAKGIELASNERVGVVAREVEVMARTAAFLVEGLSYAGTVVRAEIEQVKVVATAIETKAERLLQRVKRAYRFAEDEQLRAERIDYVAKANMSLRGENTMMTAEKLVKLDGDQIHVG